MKASFLLAVAVLLVTACAVSALSGRELIQSFSDFTIRFQRQYENVQEYNYRMNVFKANMERADTYNKRSQTATFGVTKFSDWTQAERQAYLGRLPANRGGLNRSAPQVSPDEVLAPPPPSFDLAKQNVVQKVVDQGQCGSCWAFSTAFGVSSAYASYSKTAPLVLSPQQIVDCDSTSYGCNGGDTVLALPYLKQAGGLMTWDAYPYTAQDGTCAFEKAKIAVPVTGFEWTIDSCQNTDCEKQDYIAAMSRISKYVVAPSICVYATDAWFDYTSGVFDLDCDSDYNILNHCIGFNGWETDAKGELSVIVQNSWGESWGEDGKMKISIKKPNNAFVNRCGVFDEMTFAHVHN